MIRAFLFLAAAAALCIGSIPLFMVSIMLGVLSFAPALLQWVFGLMDEGLRKVSNAAHEAANSLASDGGEYALAARASWVSAREAREAARAEREAAEARAEEAGISAGNGRPQSVAAAIMSD